MMSYEQLCAQLGSSTFFHKPPKRYNYFEDTWLSKLWKSLHDNDMNMEMEYHLPLLRVDDSYIMEDILDLQLGPKTNRILNQVRINHRVICKSELCSVDGKVLFRPTSLSKIKWPSTADTTVANERLWNRTIERLYCSHNRSLIKPLGKWKIDIEEVIPWRLQ